MRGRVSRASPQTRHRWVPRASRRPCRPLPPAPAAGRQASAASVSCGRNTRPAAKRAAVVMPASLASSFRNASGGAAAGHSHRRSGHRRRRRHGGSCAKARRWRYQPTGAKVDRRAGRPCQIHRHRARSAGRKALGGCGAISTSMRIGLAATLVPAHSLERIVRPPDASTRSQVAAAPQYTVAGATERGNPVPARVALSRSARR